MNTNKIREAIELLESMDPLNASRVADRIDEASAIIRAEIDKAPKVLTDEPYAWEWQELVDEGPYRGWHSMLERFNPLDNPYRKREASAVRNLKALYLAPPAGLTVDEAMEIVKTWHNYEDLTEEEAQDLCANETPEEAYEDLRARLTAAMEAKQKQ